MQPNSGAFSCGEAGNCKHCRPLAIRQPRDQNNRSIREFKRAVMDVGHVHIESVAPRKIESQPY
jgi:hypothetical protein